MATSTVQQALTCVKGNITLFMSGVGFAHLVMWVICPLRTHIRKRYYRRRPHMHEWRDERYILFGYEPTQIETRRACALCRELRV